MASAGRLGSWKAIATYLDRSVRTVRRWEQSEGLPVHRHVHRSLGRVFANKSELDAWQQTRARTPGSSQHVARRAGNAPPLSIAVLPFANLSDDRENAYFADGLTEEVTTTLSKVAALQVTSRTSSSTFRGTTKGAKGIAEQLGVRFLLEGSVRRTANRLRISAQLIDAMNDSHVWADTYEGAIDDIFAIQERLARVIVAALEVRLTANEEQQITERAIANIAAYECYLRARHESWRWRQDAIEEAVRLLHEALRIIGDNVRLYAALGLAHLQYREAGIDLSERPLIEAEACTAKLFALDGHSASGLQLRGWVRYSRGLIQDAVRDLKAALALEPNNADTLLLLCNCYLISGRVSCARPLLKRLSALDPLTPLTRCMPAFADIMEGNLAAAIEPYHQMLNMDPSNPLARLFYVWVLILNRRTDEIGPILAAFPQEQRDTIPGRLSFFLALAWEGKAQEAQARLSPEIEAVAKATDVFPRFLAQGFALAGNSELAMFWLDVAIRRGFTNYPFLASHDPSFLSVRNEPRFVALLDVARAMWERFEA